MRKDAYRVHGMMQSYFTRKMTGYLDYKGIPWVFRRFAGGSPEASAAGWPGGVPPIETPDRQFMWDSTAMIHHLELRFPEPAVIPSDSVLRFLCYLLEDVADEWLYRTAVGSRWSYAENHAVGGFELARDIARHVPIPCDQVFLGVQTHVFSSCFRLGVTPENVSAWMDEVLRPWLRVLGAHLATRAYLFGARPSLADFALFGGNAAHFINDPLCRRWADEDGPNVVAHTYRLCEPEDESFGDWNDEVGPTLLALLADAGRLYLPWVSRATVEGKAELSFSNGQSVEIEVTEFLKESRGILLGRYLECRTPALDRILEQAGVLRYFADFTSQARPVPDYTAPPRPALNRPFPPQAA